MTPSAELERLRMASLDPWEPIVTCRCRQTAEHFVGNLNALYGAVSVYRVRPQGNTNAIERKESNR